MKKRLISFFLALVITLSAFSEPISAMGMENETIAEETFNEQELDEILDTIASSESLNETESIEETLAIEETEESIAQSEEIQTKEVLAISETEDETEKLPSAGELIEKRSEKGYSTQLILQDVDTLGNASALVFMVWSDKNGKDDIKAYVSYGNSTTHSVDVYFADHKDAGKYNIHVYIADMNGHMSFLKSFIFEVNELPESEMKIVSEDTIKGSFDVETYIDLPRSTYTKVYVEAWTMSNKDDLYRYEGKLQQDGTYTVQIDVKNHGYHTGKYNLQCYVVDVEGKRINISSVANEVKLQAGELDVSLDDGGYSMKLVLGDVEAQGIANQLAFMVWSTKDGQDDITSYIATGAGNVYTASMPLYNHKDEGIYQAHVYIGGKDGKLHFLKAFTFEVSELPESHIKVVSSDNVKGTFDVSTYIHMPKDSYTKVYVEAWTTSNKNDLYSYEGKVQPNGTYAVQVDVKNHGYHTGEYKLQSYVVDSKGKRTNVAASAHEVKIQAGEFAASVSKDGYSMELTLSDAEVQGTAQWLAFMVWSDKDGQDDIKAYTSESNGKTYSITMPLYNHKDVGSYQVHVYIGGKDGKLHFLKAETFEVTEMPEEGIEISNIKEDKGNFDVDVYLARDPQAISSVFAYVWTRADRSDLTCYTAKKQANGSYKASVDALNHKWFSGTYQIHVYVKDAQGQLSFVDSNTTKLTLGTKAVTKTLDTRSVRITVWGVKSDVISVKIPTWIAESGSGTAHWYEGKKNADGSWSVDVHTKNHKSAGKFVSHIYAYTKEGSSYLNQVSFSIAEKWENTWRWIDGYKRYITEDGVPSEDVSALVKGPYRITVYKSLNYVIVYAKDENGDYKIPVKAMVASCGNGTPTGTFTPTSYKKEWICMVDDSWGQWCTQIIGDYLFHSIPYRSRNEKSLFVDKYNYLGTTKSLGCIRLQASEAKWIYDRWSSVNKVYITTTKEYGPLAKPTIEKIPDWHTWDPTDAKTQYLCKQKGCH